MTETSHTRSRRASLFGLVIQVVTALAAAGLASSAHSEALEFLAWLIAGGIPMWFACLLLYYQHELAELEERDLEELRRERETAGRGEAMFDQEGAAGGFRVAQARLEWMQKYLLPAAALLIVVYFAGVASWLLTRVTSLASSAATGAREWPNLYEEKLGLWLVLIALVMLVQYFFARYTSGLARIERWRLLRGCGGFLFANALLMLLITIGWGVALYSNNLLIERIVAFAIPIIMFVLAAEIALNYVLDFYRPKTPGVDPRPAFESRLAGLLSEPGGIAKSLADAINYQFGFEVSQTWFYQLLQKTLAPLIAVGVVALWLLTSIVIIQPYERGVVERFGRQINIDEPFGPGIHFKFPYPIDVVYKYETGRLYEFMVGFKVGDKPKADEEATGRQHLQLWTDDKHLGMQHFDFVATPTPRVLEMTSNDNEELGGGGLGRERVLAPVHLVRQRVLVQYRVREDALDRFSRISDDRRGDAHAMIRSIAWEEVTKFTAASNIEQLMGELLVTGGPALKRQIQARADALSLGLEVVHVGIVGVHPEKSVAEEFRNVINAKLSITAQVRQARVDENQKLSSVAGDPRRARLLADASENVTEQQVRLERANRELHDLRIEVSDELRSGLDNLEQVFRTSLEAERALELVERVATQQREDYELGLGRSLEDVRDAGAALDAQQAATVKAREQFEREVSQMRGELGAEYGEAAAEIILDKTAAEVALRYWNGQLERSLRDIEGDAAVTLADAQARRWEQELRAAGQVVRVQSERYAYEAAPEIYTARRYLQALMRGLGNARKYLMLVEDENRRLHVRVQAEEEVNPEEVRLQQTKIE